MVRGDHVCARALSDSRTDQGGIKFEDHAELGLGTTACVAHPREQISQRREGRNHGLRGGLEIDCGEPGRNSDCFDQILSRKTVIQGFCQVVEDRSIYRWVLHAEDILPSGRE